MKSSELAAKVKGILGAKSNDEAWQSMIGLLRVAQNQKPPLGAIVVLDAARTGRYHPEIISSPDPPLTSRDLILLQGALRDFANSILQGNINTLIREEAETNLKGGDRDVMRDKRGAGPGASGSDRATNLDRRDNAGAQG